MIKIFYQSGSHFFFNFPEQGLKYNASMSKLLNDCESRTNLLSNHIKSLEQLRMKEVSSLNELTKERVEYVTFLYENILVSKKL